MDLAAILRQAEAATADINLSQLVAVATAAANALPAIEQGIVQALPYIKALATVLAGGTPTADDWAALDARLDAGSQALQNAAADTLDGA